MLTALTFCNNCLQLRNWVSAWHCLPSWLSETIIFGLHLESQASAWQADHFGFHDNCLVSVVEESGERLAVLTTLEGLLRLKHLQMEGEDGTGTLESDSSIMEVGSQGRVMLLCCACIWIAYFNLPLAGCIS